MLHHHAPGDAEPALQIAIIGDSRAGGKPWCQCCARETARRKYDEELVEYPMILLDLPLSREYFLALFMKDGLEPNVYSRSEHIEVVRTMVANGLGYSLLNIRPRSDQALDGKRLKRVRLMGDNRPMVIGTATLKSVSKSRLLQAFESHCRSYVSDSYIPGMVAPVFGETKRKTGQTGTE